MLYYTSLLYIKNDGERGGQGQWPLFGPVPHPPIFRARPASSLPPPTPPPLRGQATPHICVLALPSCLLHCPGSLAIAPLTWFQLWPEQAKILVSITIQLLKMFSNNLIWHSNAYYYLNKIHGNCPV